MKFIVAFVLAIIAAGVAVSQLAGCGGSRPSMGAPLIPQSVALDENRSWMLPQAAAGDLLYVTNNNNAITVFSYPGGKYVGTINNPEIKEPEGACADKKGDVFITSWGNKKVFEYAHGGKKPLATIKTSAAGPQGCSVDAATGDLAVTTLGAGSSSPGSLEIFTPPYAKGKSYTDPELFRYEYCSYDDANGNIYVEGEGPPSGHLAFQLAELPKGSSKFTNITLNQTIENQGGVEWSGKYAVLGDANTNDLYAFAISGAKGTLKQTTYLKSAGSVVEFEISSGKIIAADHGNNDVAVYDYPAGRKPVTVITYPIFYPNGVALSVAGSSP